MGRIHQRVKLTGSALSATVAQWTQRSLIKSVQRGTMATINTSITQAVTAVVPENCLLTILGVKSGSAGEFGNAYFTRIELTTATSLTLLCHTAAAFARTTSWELIEFVPGVIKSRQAGTIAIGSVNATINPVNMSKTLVHHLGLIDSVAASSNDVATMLQLTTATNVNVQTGNTNTQVTGYEVVELF